jgi:hypothetical protein
LLLLSGSHHRCLVSQTLCPVKDLGCHALGDVALPVLSHAVEAAVQASLCGWVVAM